MRVSSGSHPASATPGPTPVDPLSTKPKVTGSSPVGRAHRGASPRTFSPAPRADRTEGHRLGLHALAAGFIAALNPAGRIQVSFRRALGGCHRARRPRERHAGQPIDRCVFAAAEWELISRIAPSLGWLGRRYPRDLDERERRDAA